MFIPTLAPRFDGMTPAEIVSSLDARVSALFARAGVQPEDVLPGGTKRNKRLNGHKWGMLPLAQAAADLHHLKASHASDSAVFIDNDKGGFYAQPGTRERGQGYDYLCAMECDRAEMLLVATPRSPRVAPNPNSKRSQKRAAQALRYAS